MAQITREAFEAARKNGRTVLDFQQWTHVRTPEFKAWFGDWEHDAAKASKLVDKKTGEPMVVYHGTNQVFDIFDKNAPHVHDSGYYGNGFYFTFGYGEVSRREAEYYGKIVMDNFINIRNPFDFSSLLTFKGKNEARLFQRSLVFLYNIAKQFPEIAHQVIDLEVPERQQVEAWQGRRINADLLVQLVEEVIPSKLEATQYIKQDKEYRGIMFVIHNDRPYTDSTGTTRYYGDIKIVAKCEPGLKSDEDLFDEAIFSVLTDPLLFNIFPNFHPEGFMTRHPEITEAIRRRGHDGIVQSWHGDEVVVFEPDQVRTIASSQRHAVAA